MILFMHDYARFPTAIVDYQTTNKSFLVMAEKYRKMGVMNNVFHLTLMNPELQGVDPFSSDLTMEQKQAIRVECQYNPWYFFREIARVPAQAGREPVRLRANRGNLALYWSFFAGLDFCLIQPRQTGKSVSTDCLMSAFLFFLTANTTINMLTKDNKLRTTNVERLKEIRDLFPAYLLVKDRTDANNGVEVTYNPLGNNYTTAVSQMSEAGALKVGRGSTAPIAHIDEIAFVKNIRVALPAMLAAGGAARDEARANGQPCGTVFTTTAGKIDDPDGGYIYDMLANASVWTEKNFDCKDRDTLHKRVMKSSRSRDLLINGTFSHKQLGYTDEWLFKKIREAKATGQDADRDFFNRWTRGSLRSPLSIKHNTVIAESAQDPLYQEITEEGYIVNWYVEEDRIEKLKQETNIVIGLDTSEAIGNDAIAMVGIDVRDGATIFAATINEVNLIVYCRFLAMFLVRNPNTTLVIEKKSTGQMIVDALTIALQAEGIDPFKRIYNKIVQNHDERISDYKAISAQHSVSANCTLYKKEFGFTTTGGSRELLYSRVLQNAATTASHLVRDKQLSGEIRGLVTKNGRIDHASKGHDDMVIAWLLAHWFMMFGKNMKHYGIREELCLSLVGDGKELTQEAIENRAQQGKIKEEIEKISTDLKEAQDGFRITMLENKLRTLTKRLTLTGSNEVKSIDSLLREASDARMKRRTVTAQKAVASTNRPGQSIVPSWFRRAA